MSEQDRIEAAALAIYIVEGGREHHFPEVWGPARETLLRKARAAIAAAGRVAGEDVTDEMVEAANNAFIDETLADIRGNGSKAMRLALEAALALSPGKVSEDS